MTLIKGRYRIIETIGRGAFGETYLTIDEDLPSKRKCVVKQLKPQRGLVTDEMKERFAQEARVLETLGNKHDRIPKLFAYFEESGEFYLVQEYIPGNTLKKLISEKKTADETYVRNFLLDILPTLEFIHSKRIIHRDIKPDNIIIRESDGKPVLIDFGLVKEMMDSELVSMTMGAGTVGFMAMEQMDGNPTKASDIYSLGMTAIALLTGGARLKRDYRTGEFQWKEEISCPLSPEFGAILTKATQSLEKDRYIRASDMFEALEGVTQQRIQVAEMPPPKALFPGEGKVGAAGIEFVYIPAGEFEMGSDFYSVEQPIHKVTIGNPFWMGKYPVTQAQWESVMGKNPSFFTGNGRLPVETVSWEDCQKFIEKLNAMKDGNLYALPTEAEWEYACRAGTKTAFSFGDVLLTSQANYNGNYPYGNGPRGEYRRVTTPVDSFPANKWGLHDLHGNVWEWCQDRWHKNYEGAPTNGRPWSKGKSEKRILRGGSWNDDALFCRSASRHGGTPDFRNFLIGFRCVIRSART